MKKYSTNTSFGAVSSERFNRSDRNLLERPVFENGDGNCVDILPTITKQCKNRIHSSTKLTLIQASSQKSEGCFYRDLPVKRKKETPKLQVNDLVRTVDIKKIVFQRRYD